MVSTNAKTEIATLIADTLSRADQVKIEKSQKTNNSVEVFISLNILVLYGDQVLKRHLIVVVRQYPLGKRCLRLSISLGLGAPNQKHSINSERSVACKEGKKAIDNFCT